MADIRSSLETRISELRTGGYGRSVALLDALLAELVEDRCAILWQPDLRADEDGQLSLVWPGFDVACEFSSAGILVQDSIGLVEFPPSSAGISGTAVFLKRRLSFPFATEEEIAVLPVDERTFF